MLHFVPRKMNKRSVNSFMFQEDLHALDNKSRDDKVLVAALKCWQHLSMKTDKALWDGGYYGLSTCVALVFHQTLNPLIHPDTPHTLIFTPTRVNYRSCCLTGPPPLRLQDPSRRITVKERFELGDGVKTDDSATPAGRREKSDWSLTGVEVVGGLTALQNLPSEQERQKWKCDSCRMNHWGTLWMDCDVTLWLFPIVLWLRYFFSSYTCKRSLVQGWLGLIAQLWFP